MTEEMTKDYANINATYGTQAKEEIPVDDKPCCNRMDFPDTFEEFAKSYGIKDSKEVYTNGSVLIPVFRVKQWLDHINPCEDRMKYVQETVDTILNTCTTNSIKDKAFRNAARFVQNAIDGQEPDFEEIDEPEPCEDYVSREAVMQALTKLGYGDEENGADAEYMSALLDVAKEIESLPRVTPKQITEEMKRDYANINATYGAIYPPTILKRPCSNCTNEDSINICDQCCFNYDSWFRKKESDNNHV